MLNKFYQFLIFVSLLASTIMYNVHVFSKQYEISTIEFYLYVIIVILCLHDFRK